MNIPTRLDAEESSLLSPFEDRIEKGSSPGRDLEACLNPMAYRRWRIDKLHKNGMEGIKVTAHLGLETKRENEKSGKEKGRAIGKSKRTSSLKKNGFQARWRTPLTFPKVQILKHSPFSQPEGRVALRIEALRSQNDLTAHWHSSKRGSRRRSFGFHPRVPFS